MPQVYRAHLGASVPLVLTAREVTSDSTDGDLFTDAIGVSITIKNPSGTEIVSGGSPFVVENGKWLYHWDASALTAGDYPVSWDVTINSDGTKVRHTRIVRLVNQGAP